MLCLIQNPAVLLTMHQNRVISFPSKRSVFNCLCNFDGIKDTKWKYLFMTLKNSRVHVFYIIATAISNTVYPKKYAHGSCFAVLCCGYTLTDFPISIRVTSLALWQYNDCPSASKATLMNMDKYFMWINYERLHNHNKAKHHKTVCIFLGIYCMSKERTYEYWHVGNIEYIHLYVLISWKT